MPREPLALLFDEPPERVLKHQFMRVSTSRFFLFNPSGQADNYPVVNNDRYDDLRASTFFLFDPTVWADENAVLQSTWYRGLRVLGDADDWWIVLFPG